jgi:hypothetical protein
VTYETATSSDRELKRLSVLMAMMNTNTHLMLLTEQQILQVLSDIKAEMIHKSEPAAGSIGGGNLQKPEVAGAPIIQPCDTDCTNDPLHDPILEAEQDAKILNSLERDNPSHPLRLPPVRTSAGLSNPRGG